MRFEHGIESHLVTTKVGDLAVRTLGHGRPVVVWSSLFVDHRSWGRVAPTLAAHRRLVIVDGPGHGASGDPGRRYSLAECADAAGVILDRLGVVDPVDWVGNAWGGHVGIRFAADHPARCSSLATFGTPVAALTAAERRQTVPLLVVYGLLGPIKPVLSGVTEALLSARTRRGDAEAVTLVHTCLRSADRRRLSRAVLSVSLGREDLTPLLPGITAPTLMVTGADHGGFTPEQARQAAAAVPSGRSATVPGAAYLVPLEAPEETVRLLRQFWAEVDVQRPPSEGEERTRSS